MRISIRRCLNMLRNTGNGNELAVPLSMPCKEHSVDTGYWICLVPGVPGLVLLVSAVAESQCPDM